jgi:hypothetical protein
MMKMALSSALSLATLLSGCKSSSIGGDADVPDAVDEERGCTVDGDCAVGVNYRDLDRCAVASAYSVSFIAAEECITLVGEVPGPDCVDCSVTTESGRGGRLQTGLRWVVTCSEGLCEASEEPCTDCPAEGECDTSLDCFLEHHCLEGSCVSGCDTGFDCRSVQVCVREPPDAEFGRCVFSG